MTALPLSTAQRAALSKERPILFSAPMVRALLAGTKTQTRRLVRIDNRPISKRDYDMGKRQRGIPTDAKNVRMIGYLKCDAPAGSATVSCRVDCPYGVLGDRLWVREAFTLPNCVGCDVGLVGMAPCVCRSRDHVGYRATSEHADRKGWKPGIHMPRWASRIQLEITNMRVQRLQDISEEDARAEGVTPFTLDSEGDCWTDGTHRGAFHYLWNEINGWDSWRSNPFVWALTFKRVEAARSAA